MCNTSGGGGHSHGVLSQAEKALADLRNDLTEVLKMVNNYEYQKAVMGGADFPAAGEVVHILEHLLESQKEHAAVLIELINKIDVTQRKMFEEGNGHEHEHANEGEHEHAHGHGHKH